MPAARSDDVWRYSPEPLNLLTNLVALLADPVAAKKRVAEFADAVTKSREAVDAAEKAQADRDRVYREIEDARDRHAQQIAESKATYEREMAERQKKADAREQALLVREQEADELIANLKKDRDDLKRRLDLLKSASAD